MYRAVPDNDFRSLYGICCFVFGSLYCFAIPKSTTWITFADFDEGLPIRKLSGLMSRYIKFFSCIVCTRDSFDLLVNAGWMGMLHRSQTITYHLLGYHNDSLGREPPLAMVE